jgi:tetratricopeptide (TPR) repeat protein
MIHRSHLLRAAACGAALAAVTLAGCSTGGKPNASPGAAARRGSSQTGPAGAFEATRRDPPIAADTRFAAGQLAESRGAFAQAAEQYQQAIQLDPKHADAMFHLGVVYAAMKKYPEAIGVWKRYIKLTGESPEAYSNLGFSYELAGRPEDAEQAYQRGIKKDPTAAACHVNYGLMLVRRGRVGEGKLQLGAVLKPAEVHYNLGSVYESQGKKAQARAEYRQALELDPQFVDATTRLAELEPVSTTPQGETGLSKTE